jgi:hypothetical protein
MPPYPLKRTIKAVKPAEGFVLPVVLAVGLITILLGTMMIERSSQNRITAIAQKANTRSSAAAEYGVAQLQALLNRYSRLATSSPLSSWATISDTALDPCGITPDDLARIRSYANPDYWSNVSANPSDGQFRLVSYEAGSGTGTFVIEGRINPDDAVSLANTLLKVDFGIARAPRVGNAPGLWIEQPQAAAIDSSVQLRASFRDPTCPGDAAHVALAEKLKMQIQSPYGYQSAPGIAFPGLPPVSSSSSLASGFTATPVGAVDNDNASVNSPKASDGQSVNLTKPSDSRTLGTGSDTVVLDLKEGLTITGGGKIVLASGSKLMIYAHGPVTLAGTETSSAIEQEGTPSAARVQIYVYPPEKASEPPYPVRLSGVEKPLYLSLFAPASKVTTSAWVQGSIWAKSLEATGSAVIKEDPISLSALNLIWPPRIAPITTWQRQENF